MNMPPRYQDAKWENLSEPLRKTIIETKKDGLVGIMFTGNPGVGKTYTAYALCSRIEEKLNIGVFCVNATSDLLALASGATFRGGYDTDERDFYERFEAHRGAFFVDDLSADLECTEVEKRILYGLVNKCYENEQYLVVTTNNTIEELRQSFGNKFISRLLGCCGVLELQGDDNRLKNHE